MKFTSCSGIWDDLRTSHDLKIKKLRAVQKLIYVIVLVGAGRKTLSRKGLLYESNIEMN